MTIPGPLDLRRPPLAPRTRLYHLAPIGVGTPEVEGLTGYVMRLAETHCVTTSALDSGELLPAMKSAAHGARPAATWLLDHGPQFNGTGEAAREAIAALAHLTGRCDLPFLTLRPWAAMLAPYGLLRLGKHARVWCSRCYTQAQEDGLPLYEPLLWSIAAVTVCPRHAIRLSARCPHADCARTLPVIAARARPGHCSHCRRPLYHPGDGPTRPSGSNAEEGWDLWVARQIGALLAAAPSLTSAPTPTTSGTALEAFIQARQGSGPGVFGQFAHTVGVHANLLCRWRKGRSRPTMALLLRVCHRLGVSLVEFLQGDTSGLAAGAHPPATDGPPRRSCRSPTAYDTDRLQQEIEAHLADAAAPPRSIAEMARRLGCPSAALVRLFPDACRITADRCRLYRTQQRDERVQHLTADIRRVMTELDSAGIYPASKRVRARLQRRIHPRNSDYNRIRRQLLEEFGWRPGGTRIGAH